MEQTGLVGFPHHVELVEHRFEHGVGRSLRHRSGDPARAGRLEAEERGRDPRTLDQELASRCQPAVGGFEVGGQLPATSELEPRDGFEVDAEQAELVGCRLEVDGARGAGEDVLDGVFAHHEGLGVDAALKPDRIGDDHALRDQSARGQTELVEREMGRTSNLEAGGASEPARPFEALLADLERTQLADVEAGERHPPPAALLRRPGRLRRWCELEPDLRAVGHAT